MAHGMVPSGTSSTGASKGADCPWRKHDQEGGGGTEMLED